MNRKHILKLFKTLGYKLAWEDEYNNCPEKTRVKVTINFNDNLFFIKKEDKRLLTLEKLLEKRKK